jgi:hypothetical protein
MRQLRSIAGWTASLIFASAAVAGAAAELSALASLQPGLWEVRELGNSNAPPPRSICVADPVLLMQLKHGQAACSRIVISDDARGATVQYTCPANGFGRTSLRVETPRLAKIDTQGIIGNAPFAYRAEIRYLGPCPKTAAGSR